MDYSTTTTDTKPDTSALFDLSLDDNTLSGMIDRRATAAETHWENKYDLTKLRKTNKELYTSEYALKKLRTLDSTTPFIDNRLFVAVSVLRPFLVGRLSQPEVTPDKGTDLALQFAEDFERVLVKVAQDANAKGKLRLAVQDLLTGQRKGVLKWSYDPAYDELCLEYIPPDAIIVDGHTRLFEEPRFLRHKQERTVDELLTQFPDKKTDIIKWFGSDASLASGTLSQAELEKTKPVNENWLFTKGDNGKPTLAVVWTYQKSILGKMTDPNWNSSGRNFLKRPMMPFIFFNFLNDGSGYEDETSFIEQAQYSQKNYDKTGQIIVDHSENASGVPVFGKGAIQDEDVAKVRFNNKQRLSLGVEDVRTGFTVWQAPTLQNQVIEDKADHRNNVDNIFGTPAIFQGKKTDSDTATQDVMLRDQAEGRQEDPVDCINFSMSRFYQLETQLIWRYFDEDHYYNFLGNDGKFESLVISSERLAKNAGIEIDVEEGSNLPVDRSQKKAVVQMLLQLNKYPTLQAYRDLGIDNPEDVYEQYLKELTDPAGAIADARKRLFNREAEQDLDVVIGGEVPEEREDITPEYVQYLNDYLLTDKFRLLKPGEQQSVSQFIQMITAKAQLKIAKLETQQPIPPVQPPVDANQPMPPNAAPQGSPEAPAAPPVAEPMPALAPDASINPVQ